MNYRFNTLAFLLAACLFTTIQGCGSEPPPEISTDLAAEIVREDQEIADAEADL